ncbi:MAG: hypothetical protein FRX49_13787, partial [Trebouxia sp. A1-2]
AKPFISEARVLYDAGLSFDVWSPETGSASAQHMQPALTVSQWVAKVVMNGQIPVQYLLAVKLWQEAIATDAAASRNARDMQK